MKSKLLISLQPIKRLPEMAGEYLHFNNNSRKKAVCDFFLAEEILGYISTISFWIFCLIALSLLMVVPSVKYGLLPGQYDPEVLFWFIVVLVGLFVCCVSLSYIQHLLLMRPVTAVQHEWCTRRSGAIGFVVPEKTMNKYSVVKYVNEATKIEAEKLTKLRDESLLSIADIVKA